VDLRLEALFPLEAGDLDLDLDLDLADLDGDREREAEEDGPRDAPEAARLAVVVLRGLGVDGFVTSVEEDALAFFVFLTVFLVLDEDGLRPLEEDGLRPRPDPVPEEEEEEEEEPVLLLLLPLDLDLDLDLAGFLAFTLGDLLRLLRTFFSAAGLAFFSPPPAFLAAVGDKRKLCLF